MELTCTLRRKNHQTFGFTENVKFQLGHFDESRNSCWAFQRGFQVLVDLTARKVIFRAPSKPVWYQAHAQVSNELLNASVAIAQAVVLHSFELTISRSKMLPDNLEPFIFQKSFD